LLPYPERRVGQWARTFGANSGDGHFDRPIILSALSRLTNNSGAREILAFTKAALTAPLFGQNPKIGLSRNTRCQVLDLPEHDAQHAVH
jgi:hypothetical protein